LAVCASPLQRISTDEDSLIGWEKAGNSPFDPAIGAFYAQRKPATYQRLQPQGA